MHAVYIETIDKYARGEGDSSRIKNQFAMFKIISEMVEPNEINLLVFDSFGELDKKIIKKDDVYEPVYRKIKSILS